MRYSEDIRKCGIKEVVKESGISSTYLTEVSKAVNLAKYVKAYIENITITIHNDHHITSYEWHSYLIPFKALSSIYGYGKNLPTFFALFPLSDAPYTAAYEEQEVFSAFHDYLAHAEEVEILPAASLLLAEYIRFIINRSVYYYPPMLPKEMLSDEVKTGEVVRDLWIALEDLHDGWRKSGEVGQEVYGAGMPLGVVPRHYFKVPDEDFMIFIDYPTSSFSSRKGKSVSFNVLGSEMIDCRLIITGKNIKLSKFHVIIKEDVPKGFKNNDGNIEYILRGNQRITISWIK